MQMWVSESSVKKNLKITFEADSEESAFFVGQRLNKIKGDNWNN